MPYEMNNTATPARKRKILLVKAAVEKRGLEFADLIPANGLWTVRAFAPRGGGGLQVLANGIYSKFNTFEEALHTLVDDIAFAAYIHRKLGDPKREWARNYRGAFGVAKSTYGNAHVRKLERELRGDTTPGQGLAIELAEARMRAAYAEMVKVEHDVIEYDATVPTTQEAAAVYLANLPRTATE